MLLWALGGEFFCAGASAAGGGGGCGFEGVLDLKVCFLHCGIARNAAEMWQGFTRCNHTVTHRKFASQSCIVTTTSDWLSAYTWIHRKSPYTVSRKSAHRTPRKSRNTRKMVVLPILFEAERTTNRMTRTLHRIGEREHTVCPDKTALPRRHLSTNQMSW